MKRILVLSDLHCGHVAGLTHPDYFSSMMAPNTEILWKSYSQAIADLGKIHLCIANGDLIDGRGERSGGTELWTGDRMKQGKCAIKCLEEVNADEYFFTFGTPYHASAGGEDFETPIAEHFNARITGQGFIKVNGLTFHVKHKIGTSSIPHGRLTPLARQKLWNLFWAEHGEAPKADIFIRSHTHYFDYAGGYGWLAVITPALQGWGSKFGERQCEGTIDWGFIYFDVESKNEWSWGHFINKTIQKVHVSEF